MNSTDYLRLLAPWVRAAKQHLYVPPDRRDLLVYGVGCDGWGVQTQQKALAALAVLSADGDLDESAAGASRDELADLAVRMLRFNLSSHIEGDYRCTDGRQWGHTWISALGVERMMHGVEAIWPRLADADRDLLRRVLISEGDWLLDEYPVRAGVVENNVPESNLWNGAILHRTAMMCGDAPRAAEYREKGTRFLINSISVPSDAESDEVIAGRAVRDWHVGANFFPSYGLNHHRYLNVGYMVICLSNAAMLHFAYRERGIEPPAGLYHHAADLWRVVKACTFPDGRLCRIGGDTRVRYCYCQDYCIPAWLLMGEHFADANCAAFEAGWLDQVAVEQQANGDGSFLSIRCAGLAKASPLYYTRLESDRAVTLSMGAYWRRVLRGCHALDRPRSWACSADTPSPGRPSECPTASGRGTSGPECFAWNDEYHGASLHRSAGRIASWSWDAAEKPQGLIVPTDRSDLAEWRQNLAGSIEGEGRHNVQEVLEHHEQAFDGGFLTWGRTAFLSKNTIAEGLGDQRVAEGEIVFAALSDGATVLLIQRARCGEGRAFLQSVHGVGLLVPNDLFNGCVRRYASAVGEGVCPGGEESEPELLPLGRWVCVDDVLSVVLAYGTEDLSLHRPGRRQIGLRAHAGANAEAAGGMLWADEIAVVPEAPAGRLYDAGATLYDLGAVLRVGQPAAAAADYADAGQCGPLHDGGGDVRGIFAVGADGRAYALLANFGASDVEYPIPTSRCRAASDLAAGERFASAVPLAAGQGRLLRLEA